MKKTPGDVIILHKCTKNHDYVLYCSWDMVRDRCNYFSFWANFCPFTPLTAWKMKIFKKWKKPLGYHHFTCVYQKLWLDDVRFLRNGAWQTDRHTNGKSDTEVGAPPKNSLKIKFLRKHYIFQGNLNFVTSFQFFFYGMG